MDRQHNVFNQQFRLSDGRWLGFAEYGVPTGEPVFYFHGWPGSRHEPRMLHALCDEMGLRLLAPDRPGYGLSDFQQGRTLQDWPKEVCKLADHLGADRFAVLGMSGGGPYALACAAAIPDRLTAVLLVNSVAPADDPGSLDGMVGLNRWLIRFARAIPWIAERLAGPCMRAFWKQGRQAIPAAIEKRLPPIDKLALENVHLRQTLIASSVEALRNGTRGAVADGLLIARPWGFRLREVRMPIRLWHGESDVVVPVSMGRCLARLLPKCHATFSRADGHFSLPFNHAREILEAIRNG